MKLSTYDNWWTLPFAFSPDDVSSACVLEHMLSIFSMFGMPSLIPTDGDACFNIMSNSSLSSQTTAYNPQDN